MMRNALLVACTVALLYSVGPLAAQPQATLSEQEAFSLGVDAYIFGYPLITTDMTRRVMTNVAKPGGTHAPMGQFYNASSYPDAAFRDITATNADTLYSTA